MSALHTCSHDKAVPRSWLRQDYPFAGAPSMDAITYAAVWLAARGKF